MFEWKGENSNPRVNIISCLKAYRFIAKGFLYNIVIIRYLSFEFPPIESVPIIKEFPEFFPDYLP